MLLYESMNLCGFKTGIHRCFELLWALCEKWDYWWFLYEMMLTRVLSCTFMFVMLLYVQSSHLYTSGSWISTLGWFSLQNPRAEHVCSCTLVVASKHVLSWYMSARRGELITCRSELLAMNSPSEFIRSELCYFTTRIHGVSDGFNINLPAVLAAGNLSAA
jgi:hypothetical protein